MTGGDNNIYQQHDGHQDRGGKPDAPSRGVIVKVGLMFLSAIIRKIKEWRQK